MSRSMDSTKLNLDSNDAKKFKGVQKPLQNEQARRILQMKQLLLSHEENFSKGVKISNSTGINSYSGIATT